MKTDALVGIVTPSPNLFNARAENGDNYRSLANVASLGSGPVGQGGSTTGKVYFDVVGSNPNSVVFNNGFEDILGWIQPPGISPAEVAPPASGGGGGGEGSGGSTGPNQASPDTPAATLPAATVAVGRRWRWWLTRPILAERDLDRIADPDHAAAQQPARRRQSHDLQLDVADPQTGAGFGRDVALVDSEVAAGRAGVDRVAEVLGRPVDQLLRLDGDVPVSRSVVSVAHQTPARLGDDGLDGPRRKAPRLRDVDSKDSHRQSVRAGRAPAAVAEFS